jgi:hypothetical protein
LSWLYEAASPPLQYRALSEVAPVYMRDPDRLAALSAEVLGFKPAAAVARKQKDTGLWGGNLLAPAASRAMGWAEQGTVFQYLRLTELGWPAHERPFRVADRLLFRLLSRDEDPVLLAEFQRPARSDAGLAFWARSMGRTAAAAALARRGHIEDPRLRGIAHKVISDMSAFLRGELAAKPFRRASGRTVLDPAATPPNVFSIVMLAFLPSLQRERAGFMDRLAAYLAEPAPKRAWVVQAGKHFFKPYFEILGDPLGADAQGRVKDVPFAVYWLELLARLGIVRQVPRAALALARLLSECDPNGIWSPKALRGQPKSANPVVSYYYPLEGAGKSPAQRQTDVSFCLALIAQLMGLPIEVV